MAKITKHTSVGQEFAGKPNKVALERAWAFSGGRFRPEGWPSKNVHTDLEYAKSCGLPSIAISATQYMGYMAHLMIDLFDAEWLSQGSMDVRFTRIVDAGDVLVSRAVVKSKDAEAGATKFILDVRCDNQRDEEVLIGQATGFVGKGDRAWAKQTYDKRLAELKAMSTPFKSSERPHLDPLEYIITPELNQQFMYAQEDYHPRYFEETESGPPIAHPGLILNWSNATRSPSFKITAGEWGMHSHDEAFFLNPARVGKKVKVSWKWIGHYEKRNRIYSTMEVLVVDEDGLEIIRRLAYDTKASKEIQITT